MGPLLVATGLLSCAATNPLGRQGEGQEAHQAMNQVRRSQSRERSHSHHRQNRGNHLRRSGRSDDVRQSLVIWSSLCPTDTIHRRFRVGRGFEKEQWYSRGSSNLQGGRGGPTSAADGESISGIPGPIRTFISDDNHTAISDDNHTARFDLCFPDGIELGHLGFHKPIAMV